MQSIICQFTFALVWYKAAFRCRFGIWMVAVFNWKERAHFMNFQTSNILKMLQFGESIIESFLSKPDLEISVATMLFIDQVNSKWFCSLSVVLWRRNPIALSRSFVVSNWYPSTQTSRFLPLWKKMRVLICNAFKKIFPWFSRISYCYFQT